MFSTRTYSLIFLFFYLVSSISANSHVRRAGPNDNGSKNLGFPMRIQDLLNKEEGTDTNTIHNAIFPACKSVLEGPSKPSARPAGNEFCDELGKASKKLKTTHSEVSQDWVCATTDAGRARQWANWREGCSSFESQPLAPGIDYTMDTTKVDSYALRVPQKLGETSEARFDNQRPADNSANNDGTFVEYVPNKPPKMHPIGAMIVIWTLGKPWMFTIPSEEMAVVREQGWEGKKSEEILKQYRERLQKARAGELKNTEFRGCILLADLDGLISKRSAFYGKFLLEFQRQQEEELVGNPGRFKVDTVGVFNWRVRTDVGRDCRVKCEYRKHLTGLALRNKMGPKGIHCQIYLSPIPGNEKPHASTIWEFEVELEGGRSTLKHFKSKRQARIEDFSKKKKYSDLDQAEVLYAP